MTTDEILSAFRELHPLSGDPVAMIPQSFTWVATDVGNLKKACLRFRAGKSPGVSGWTKELLALGFSTPLGAAALAAMTIDILNNYIDEEVAAKLRSCRLRGIPKKGSKKVRPIAIGEAILRLAGKLGLLQVQDAMKSLSPLQLALEENGAETIVHQVRAELKQGKLGVFLDLRNAFNAIHRKRIRQALLNANFSPLPLGILQPTVLEGISAIRRRRCRSQPMWNTARRRPWPVIFRAWNPRCPPRSLPSL